MSRGLSAVQLAPTPITALIAAPIATLVGALFATLIAILVAPLAMPIELSAQQVGGVGAVEAELRVEIPAGSIVKYEIDPHTGIPHVDRFLPGDEPYPANYGYLPGTCAGDGDALDALILTRTPVATGVHIRMRVLAVLRMRDAGEADDKLVGVPAAGVDDTGLGALQALPDDVRARVEGFFMRYKLRPDGTTPVELGGWGDEAEAAAIVAAARADHSCH